VNWCIDCGSALAEAEVEYEDRTSPAVDVAFEAVDPAAVAEAFDAKDKLAKAYAVIWTTTPWTLPGNQAIAAHADICYVLVDTDRGALILAEPLNEAALKRYGLAAKSILGRATGVALEGLAFRHPFIDRVVPMVLAGVTTESGQPGAHGARARCRDFEIGVSAASARPARGRRGPRYKAACLLRGHGRARGGETDPRDSRRPARSCTTSPSSTAIRIAGATRRRSSSARRRSGSSRWTRR
jgi:hypothetical protein